MAKLRPHRSVRDNYRRLLPRLVRRYFRRGRQLVLSQAGNAELHRFRIRTKRIRYVAELYAELFPITLRGALGHFRRIQTVLGNLQDQCMVIAYFEGRLAQVRTPIRQTEYLRLLHRARLRQLAYRTAFFQRWARLERIAFEKRLLRGIARAAGRK